MSLTDVNQGVRQSVGEMTKTRHIAGHDVPGYIDTEAIREAFNLGATFKFSQPEHWHPLIGDLVQDLSRSFHGQTEAFVFLSPPDVVAMPAHMDGSHVFVLQLAGRKEWHVANPDETTTGLPERYRTSTLDDKRRIDVTLEPGNVLYMPHGTPHYAMAIESNSIHIAITVEEPTTRDLADVLLADSLINDEMQALTSAAPQRSPADNVAALRLTFGRYLEDGVRSTEDLVLDAARLKTHGTPLPMAPVGRPGAS